LDKYNKVFFIHFHEGEHKVDIKWPGLSSEYRKIVGMATFDVSDPAAMEFA
jgi:hypothetical protein